MAISDIKRREKAVFGLRMMGLDHYIGSDEVPQWERMLNDLEMWHFVHGMQTIYDGSGAGLDLSELLTRCNDDERMAILTVLQLLIAPTWE